MFVGRKEFMDKINDLQEKLNKQCVINEALINANKKLGEKINSLETLIAINALEKIISAMDEPKEKKAKKVTVKKGAKKKCSK